MCEWSQRPTRRNDCLLARRFKINPSCELGGQHGLPKLREEENSLKEQIQTLYNKVNLSQDNRSQF